MAPSTPAWWSATLVAALTAARAPPGAAGAAGGLQEVERRGEAQLSCPPPARARPRAEGCIRPLNLSQEAGRPERPAGPELRQLSERSGRVHNAGLSHWQLHGYGGHPEGAGNSWYARAFDLLQTGYALSGFQIGLGGAWLLPDAEFDSSKCPCGQKGVRAWCTDGTCRNRGGCADVWETMEGGLGYWRNELPSPHVKWRLNNVNGCYANEMMGVLWGFLGDPISCDEMGFVVVSNRLVMPPDGLSFEHPPDYGMLGQAFVRTTLGRTGPGPHDPGAFTYLLVLDAANFAGPVGYTLEEFWRDNKGYPEAPDFSRSKVKIGSTGFEFNGINAFTSSQGSEEYLKIPKLQFPIEASGRTTILAGVRSWGEAPLLQPLEAALEGRGLPETLLRLADGSQTPCRTQYDEPIQLGFRGTPLLHLGGSMRFTRREGECVSEIAWDAGETVCRGGFPRGGGSCKVPDVWHVRSSEPAPEPAPPGGAVDFGTVDCAARCRAAGFCCSGQGVHVGSNQYLSCLQACDIRKRGLGQGTCLAHCQEVAQNRGCHRRINGQDYYFCSRCNDLRSTAKCKFGVAGAEACSYGCSMAGGTPGPKPGGKLPRPAGELPPWSSLGSREFREKTYSSVPKLDAVTSTSRHGSCLSSPGPSDNAVHCVRTKGGSVVGFRWYRFVDQPALQRSRLSAEQKAYLQRRVERLHELLEPRAPVNRWMEAPPQASRLAELDTTLLVSPPKGMERGYVPIAVYEGESDSVCAERPPQKFAVPGGEEGRPEASSSPRPVPPRVPVAAFVGLGLGLLAGLAVAGRGGWAAAGRGLGATGRRAAEGEPWLPMEEHAAPGPE